LVLGLVPDHRGLYRWSPTGGILSRAESGDLRWDGHYRLGMSFAAHLPCHARDLVAQPSAGPSAYLSSPAIRWLARVLIEFDQHRSPKQYMLVANIRTRRIHQRYVERKERALGGKEPEPRPLVITIEEAHKFLSPRLAGQTIFGTIAREMRKYNVTLLVVDQRPSGIDTEVLSQLGTKVTCLLDDDRDIDAVLAGTSGAASLRGVLASLETKQQALILGHAVPMPVVIHTREYDTDEFAKSMGVRTEAEKAAADAELRDIFT